MSDNNSIVKRTLCNLNANVTPKVKKNSQHVEEFIKKFKATLVCSSGPNSFTVTMVHGGSAYEGLAVNEMADFDIMVILGEPFVSENFIVTRDEPSGFFTLEWKSHVSDKRLSDCDGYLEAAKLRMSVFRALKEHVEKIQIPNAKVICKEGFAALTVLIKYDTGREDSIDLVPQIFCRTWGQCPGLKPLCEMPKALRCYIDTLNKNKSPTMSFSLAVPGAGRYANPDQLFNISFSLLEKEFVTSHTDLRDMIRLVKIVAERCDWKNRFSFQSYFAKRVAVKNCDKLEEMNLWDGYKAILHYLHQELNSPTIDGYFISNQVTWKWTPEKALEFQEEISHVLKLDAKAIEKL